MTTQQRPPVLSVEGLCKTFPGARALRDVDLSIQAGEIHALVGQNGSGKSTLIKILAGVHDPDAGARAKVDGRPLALGDSRAAHDLGIRFVHQDLGLVDNLSAVDNMALGFGYVQGIGGRIRWRAQRDRAVEALRHVVDDFPVDRLAGSLTVFQRTALAIARALQDWREHGALLVLDEPTATMPRSEVEHLFGLLRRIRARGTPVLLVTHHMEEVFAVSDRVTVLRDGQVVTTAEASDLDTARVVHLMTGGHSRRLRRPAGDAAGDVVLSLRRVSGTVTRDLDLEVRRGEIVGVAGLGGSGREEICSLVFGAAGRKGEVAIDGQILPRCSPEAAVRRGVGLVPAQRHRQGLVMTQTVRQNMTLTTLRDFVGRGRIRHRAEAAAVREDVARFGVKTRSPESGVASLSGGNQQKVVIAKWLRMRPKVLLLDEPTQGVDIAAQADLHQLIIEAAAAGTAVLVCSSDEFELSQVCDRVLVMGGGVVVDRLDRERATAEGIFEATLQASPTAAPDSPDPLPIGART